MDQVTDFYGYEFESEYLLLGDEFEDLQGIYVVYTKKVCLDLGVTEKLKSRIETHENTRDWLLKAAGDTVHIAFRLDEDPKSRQEIASYLRDKMHPLYTSTP